jgi:hypothetical protein
MAEMVTQVPERLTLMLPNEEEVFKRPLELALVKLILRQRRDPANRVIDSQIRFVQEKIGQWRKKRDEPRKKMMFRRKSMTGRKRIGRTTRWRWKQRGAWPTGASVLWLDEPETRDRMQKKGPPRSPRF